MAGEDDAEADDKTEAASPRRIEKAREEGQVALSKELSGLGAMLGGLLGVIIAVPLAAEMVQAFRGAFARAHEIPTGAAAIEMARRGLLVVLPVAALAGFGAAATTLLQTRMLVSAKGLVPQVSRLNPMTALKRIVGMDGAIDFLRTLLKLALVGGALWHALGDPAVLPRLMAVPAAALLEQLGQTAWDLAFAALLAFGLIAGLDWLLVTQRHLRKLRMSRQDQKDEAKEAEGDPHVRGRQRQIRQQRARTRMMAAVPRAAVIVTNPTHFAVALAYEQGGETAPRLVAKGADEVAARIREVGAEAGVPIVSNPPLARALFKLELDTEIPPEHYQAVAEIIAYVWRLGGRGTQAG